MPSSGAAGACENLGVATRVICFDESAPNVQYLLKTISGARVMPARRPAPADFHRLNSYGKFLFASCKARHTHTHFHYAGAFGILLVSIDLWAECVRLRKPMLVFEENAELRDVDELRACAQAFLSQRIDLLMLHTYGKLLDSCSETASDTAGVLHKTPRGELHRLSWPLYSAKGYLISPRFAAHLLRLVESRIDNVHVDVFLTMEAMSPSMRKTPFRSALYVPRESRGILRTLPKSYDGIVHLEVRRNDGGTVTARLRDFMNSLLGWWLS